MEQVALTGATGFIGKRLLIALNKAGFAVRALTRRDGPGPDAACWVKGDLSQDSALRLLVEGCSAVIHCAGAVRGNSLDDFLATNVGGTEKLLDACLEETPPPRFLLISSLAARRPDYSWYSRSKAMAETALMSERYAALSRTIYRPTAVYGPGDRELRPLLRLMRRGLLPTPRTPDARFSLLHVDDLADAVLKWLGAEKISGRFELDDGAAGGYRWKDVKAIGQNAWKRSIVHVQVPVSLLRVFARINLLCARLLRRKAMLTPGKINEIAHDDWTCDNAPLAACLGWQPKIRLADAIKAASI